MARNRGLLVQSTKSPEARLNSIFSLTWRSAKRPGYLSSVSGADETVVTCSFYPAATASLSSTSSRSSLPALNVGFFLLPELLLFFPEKAAADDFLGFVGRKLFVH
jgi:hypothetical protein